MRTYGGVDVLIHVFVNSALVGGDGQLHDLATLAQEKCSKVSIAYEAEGPQNCYGLHGEENTPLLPGLEHRALDRLASSQSLYLLCYPGSLSYPHFIQFSLPY
jgi:hypothetical protein